MNGNPFGSSAAIKNSSLHFPHNGNLVPFERSMTSLTSFLFEAHLLFHQFVMEPDFPCLGAKAALNNQTYGFAAYSELASKPATAGLCRDLCYFMQLEVMSRREYATFIAVFHSPVGITESEFEKCLWRQLRDLHREDAAHFEWDSHVSADPRSSHFSFSFAGQAFYVLGMHANSSRMSRRFRWPALVFNPHEQFERLRTDGRWTRMQHTIRAREIALQGSINPMLSDFGEESEARQYSGRTVPDDWAPPFPNFAYSAKKSKCPFAH